MLIFGNFCAGFPGQAGQSSALLEPAQNFQKSAFISQEMTLYSQI
jgi:hypothetical protein